MANSKLKVDFAKDGELDRTLGNFQSGDNKCNVFCEFAIEGAGVDAPQYPSNNPGISWPIRANDWANPKFKIKNFRIVEDFQRGDIVALPRTNGESGHMGIVVGKTWLGTPIVANAVSGGARIEWLRFVLPGSVFGTGDSVYRRYFGGQQ